ncbi:MAG: discoidin domain-containing protein [Opitutales bacterium]|nr:discoidin domain-containing protein [Opitutales bacterium]
MSQKFKFALPALFAGLALSTFVPEGLAATNPMTLLEKPENYIVTGTQFTATFSKSTGTLESLVYNGKDIIAGGNGPKINAYRAIINNDGWAYGKWFDNGLFNLKQHVVGKPAVSLDDNGTITLSFVVRAQGTNAGKLKGDPLIQYGSATNGVPVKIELGRELGGNDLEFVTHQIWTVYPDGSVELAANISSNKAEFDLPRLGYKLDVPAEFSTFTYYGRGPWENYKDRKSGSFVGIYSANVADEFIPYTKPQENANHEDVRWCALTDEDGDGAIFIASENTFAAQALPVTANDLLLASNPYKLEEKIKNTTATTLNLDAGVRGLGGASCGPDTEKRDKVFAVPTDFGFIIRPLNANDDMSDVANVAPAGTVPISITRNLAGAVSVSSKKADNIFVSVNGAPAQKYTGTIPFKNGGTIAAFFQQTPNIQTEISFPKIEKIRTAVVFASSENGGNETANNLTDNDPSTIWHTAYSVTQADYPHWIDFDIGEVKKIKGVSYLPRQDGGNNGDVKAYEIYVSDDGKTWGAPVASGDFSSDKAEKKIIFPQALTTRYVRFRALSSQNGQIFASGAEFSVLED